MNGETIRGLKNSYIEVYLGEKEAERCISKWSKLEKRHWISFNPAAWLFSFLWLFHKKMYREFVVFLAAFFILPIIVGGIAGISKMEGDITPKAVYSELRRIPVIYGETTTGPCVYERKAIENYWNYFGQNPVYVNMLRPLVGVDVGWGFFDINSEPAFYFGFFRVLTMLALNVFLAVYGNRLYFRSVRRNILRQLVDMSTDEESSRLRILTKSGRENAFKAQQMKLAPIFALVCVILPFFYDAICIIY